jgi:carbamate kinase
MTQGEIGFALQNSVQMAFRKHKINRSVVTIITQVVVDKNDPAFQRPTKPIGPFYSKETAERKRKELGWNIIEDAARGYRRVVASPLPKGIEAVIDKDRASALLAAKLGIEHFIISTEVPEVYINYKKSSQQKLRAITLAEAQRHFVDGQFSEGSMKPKIEAAMDFLKNGGKMVTITDPEHLIAALDGDAGTRIMK